MPKAERMERAAKAVLRTQGWLLAIDTIEHNLKHQLARIVLRCEFLAGDLRLPGDLRQQAHEASESALSAMETCERLRHLACLDENPNLPGVHVLSFGEPGTGRGRT
jgi:hypothetical protein